MPRSKKATPPKTEPSPAEPTSRRRRKREVEEGEGLPKPLKEVRVGIYARVSSERQANTQDGSIESQVDRLERQLQLLNENPDRERNYTVIQRYVDAGRSGKDLNRPDVTLLLQDVREGRINCVAVTKIDRITRSLRDFTELDAIFTKHRVTLISLDDHFDTSTAMGRAMQQLLIVFAELERKLTGERTAKHMDERALKGLYNGGYRPWGYQLNPEHRGVPLVDPEQKKDILAIYQEYKINSKSLRDLQRWMQRSNIVRPIIESRNKKVHGGTVPDASSLAKLLCNPFYIGKVSYKGEVYDGKHEPLFKTKKELALWKDVQKKLAERSTTNERATRGGWKDDAQHIFILNSILVCGLCGSAISHDSGTGRDGTRRFYYTCVARKRHGKNRCSCPSIPATAIEDAILSRLKTFGIDDKALHAIISKADAGKGDEIQRCEEKGKRLKESLRLKTKEISAIMDVLKAEGASKFASLRDELEALEAAKKDIEADLDAVNTRIAMLEAERVPDEMIVASYRRLEALLKEADRPQLQTLLPKIIHKITWFPAEDGSKGGRYKMSLYPTPLVPKTLEGSEEGEDGVGSHCCSEWLPSEAQYQSRPGSPLGAGLLILWAG